MWRLIQKKYNLTVKRLIFTIGYFDLHWKFCNNRETVQMLLLILDPIAVTRRKSCRLKRRVYQNKVSLLLIF